MNPCRCNRATCRRAARRAARLLTVLLAVGFPCVAAAAGDQSNRQAAPLPEMHHFDSLRLAVGDLADSFGPKYRGGRRYLERIEQLRQRYK